MPINTLKIDANTPTLLSAHITSVTTINLTFSEDLNGQTVTNADFSIAGHMLVSPDTEVNGVVSLTVSEPFVSGETPEVVYNTTSNGVKDLAGNMAPGATIISTNGL